MKKEFLIPKRVVFFCLFLFFSAASIRFAGPASARASGGADSEHKKDNLAQAYTHYTMGILYDNNDNLRRALEEYKKALKHDSSSSAINMRLSFAYIKLGQYDNAINQLNAAIKSCGDNNALRLLLAFLYALTGRFSDASAEYEKMLAASPEEPSVLSTLVDLYVAQGRFKEAVILYAKLAKHREISSLVHFNMGILYSRLGNFKASEYCLNTAVMQLEKEFERTGLGVKETHMAHFYLATLYERMGARDDAKRHLRRAIYLYPDDGEALNYLGYMYVEGNEKLDYAIFLIKKALDFEPTNGAYLDSLGWAYFKKGMMKEALHNLENAQELMPDPVISEHLQKVKERMKER